MSDGLSYNDSTISFNKFRRNQRSYDDEDTFDEMLAEKSNEDAIKEQKHLESVIQESKSRIKKVEVFFEKLYEKNINGEVIVGTSVVT